MTSIWASLVCGLLLGSAGCAEPESAGNVSEPRPMPTTATAIEMRGVALQLRTSHKAVKTYLPLIREIDELGANTILLSPAGYMEHAESQNVFIDARKVPSDEDFRILIRHARQMELDVIVMPIVLLSNPRGSEWRGVIQPPNWDTWWEQYRSFVTYFADIAREGGATSFIVGSELVSTERHTAQWIRTIEAVRERFPKGKLGYSANWDHYRPVQYWEKLDFVGMTSYYTLADRENPTVDEIVRRWEPVKKEILSWQAEVGKPIVFTEVGWCSQSGAATAPWNYYHNQKATPAGLEEQRRLYEAFIEVWHDAPAVLGVIWWEWTTGSGGPGDFGYTPKNKPAENVLRRWFERANRPTSTQPTTSSKPAGG